MGLVPLHRSQRSSLTAQAVLLWRAMELSRRPGRRIVRDEYAPLFLPSALRVLAEPLARTAIVRDRLPLPEISGLSTFVLCRHRFIDERLLTALHEGIDQIVVLGAGYDSRAYRFAAEIGGRPFFELDLPPLSRHKAAVVAAHQLEFGYASVRRVEIDFRTQSVSAVLLEAGFRRRARTFVVWEGVAPYLDETSVAATLDALHDLCGPGSVLAADFWDTTGGPGPLAPLRRLGGRAIGLVGEPVTFGLPPADAAALLGRHGWAIRELIGARTLDRQYVTDARRSSPPCYVVTAEPSA